MIYEGIESEKVQEKACEKHKRAETKRARKQERCRATMIKRERSRLYRQRNSEQQREIEREKARPKRQRSNEEQGEKSEIGTD